MLWRFTMGIIDRMLVVINRLTRRIIPTSVKNAGKELFRPLRTWIQLQGNRRFVNRLIASGQPVFLEIGAGRKPGGRSWVTADLCDGADIRMDLLEPFPFPDQSVDLIYSSHVLEHFSTRELESILQECLRVLKPGSKISVCVPNAVIYVDAYLNPKSFDTEGCCGYKPAYDFYSSIDYLNYVAYMGGQHRHLFDLENLLAMLSKNGFRNARERTFDSEIDLAERKHESIYAEAEK